MKKNMHETVDYKTKLPLSIAELRNKTDQYFFKNYLESFERFKKKYGDSIFPQGKGSNAILSNERYYADLPHFIVERDDGSWGLFSAQNWKTVHLKNHGWVKNSTVFDYSLSYVKVPENLEFSDYLNDSALLMDTILNANYFYRTVAGEKIKITSLGKADSETVYQDDYGRQWLLHRWNLKYSDMVVLTATLPLPNGYFTIIQSVSAAFYYYVEDLKSLANFVACDYSGTVVQWQSFLASRQYAPTSLADFKVFQGSDKLEIADSNFRLDFDKENFNISTANNIVVGMSFHRSKKDVVYDLMRVGISENDQFEKYYLVSKIKNPLPHTPKVYLDEWNHVVNKTGRYNMKPYNLDGYKAIRGVLDTKTQNEKFYFYLRVQESESDLDLRDLAKDFVSRITIFH